MQIAVSGWYFEKKLFSNFSKIINDFDITVVTFEGRADGKCPRKYDDVPPSDKIKDIVIASGVNHCKGPNGGLEWGDYDYYIKNIWDGKSPVLFMHDDIKIYNVNVFYEIEEKMRLQKMNQAFIFRDEVEEVANGRMHGRGVYCSAEFINFALSYKCKCRHSYDHEHPHYLNQNPKVILKGTGEHNGFWYDKFNLGEVLGKVPLHCRHYNEGIYHFAAFAGRCHRKDLSWPGMEKVREKVYFPDFNSGKRGVWTGPIYSREKI